MKTNEWILALVTVILVLIEVLARATCPPPVDGWNTAGGSGIAQSVLAMTRDGPDRLVAVGYQDRSDLGTRRDWRVTSYDAGGQVVWQQQFVGGGNLDEEATAVAPHPGGGVYVAGSWNQNQWQIMWLDHDGQVRWIRSYVSPGASTGLPDPPTAAAATPDGGVVVTGYEPRPDLGTGTDWLIRKYDAAGNLLWSRTWSSSGYADDEATGVGVDAAGNIVVAGFEYRSGVSQGYNWVIRRYTSSGVPLSATGFTSTGTDSTDRAWSVAVAPDGGYVVAGESAGHAMVRAWDVTGRLRWSVADLPADPPGAARAVALTAGGAVIVAGSRGTGIDSEDWFVRGYGISGAAAWATSWNGLMNRGDRPRTIVVDGAGRFAVGGFRDLYLTIYDMTVPCPPPSPGGGGSSGGGSSSGGSCM